MTYSTRTKTRIVSIRTKSQGWRHPDGGKFSSRFAWILLKVCEGWFSGK